MYKYFQICLLAMLLVATNVYSKGTAKSSAHSNALTVDPFGLSYGSFNIKYENKLNAENSFTVALYMNDKDDWSGYGVSASYRWYIARSSATPLNGLSAGPFVILTNWNWKGSNGKNYSGGSDLGLGGELNYKWVIGDWFTVEPNLQLFLPVRKADNHDFRGWSLGVSLGYSW